MWVVVCFRLVATWTQWKLGWAGLITSLPYLLTISAITIVRQASLDQPCVAVSMEWLCVPNLWDMLIIGHRETELAIYIALSFVLTRTQWRHGVLIRSIRIWSILDSLNGTKIHSDIQVASCGHAVPNWCRPRCVSIERQHTLEAR